MFIQHCAVNENRLFAAISLSEFQIVLDDNERNPAPFNQLPTGEPFSTDSNDGRYIVRLADRTLV